MIVVVDGNEGTGKSTLVDALRRRGFEVRDRGVPSRMIDTPDARWEEGEVYLLLDAPVAVCRARLAEAGHDVRDRSRTEAELERCRAHYLSAAAELPHCAVLDCTGSAALTFERALTALARLGVTA